MGSLGNDSNPFNFPQLGSMSNQEWGTSQWNSPQGGVEEPTYEQVCSGTTGHTEATQLIFDPAVCSYERLCETLFQTIAPDATALLCRTAPATRGKARRIDCGVGAGE